MIVEISASPSSASLCGGDGDHGRDLGSRVGDELLGTVDHPGLPVQDRGGPQGARVRTRLRFGQGEGGQRPASQQVRKPALFLFLRCRNAPAG